VFKVGKTLLNHSIPSLNRFKRPAAAMRAWLLGTVLLLGSARAAELEDDCTFHPDDTSFLQEKIQVTKRLETGSVSQLAESEDITPASAKVDRSLFGTRVVHFPPWIYIGVVAFLVLGGIHEWFVSRGMTPLGVRTSAHQSLGIQLMGLWNSAAGFISMSMQIPISLDFALSLNRGATESGLFLSAGIITGLLAMAAGKGLVDETNWNQRWVRNLMIYIPIACMLVNLISAVFINETAANPNVNMVWWTMLGLIQITAFIGPLTIVPGIIFWTKITVHESKTFWMIMTQCARNTGLVIGPLIFTVLKTLVTGDGDRVSPRSMMAWINVFLLFMSLVSSLCAITIMPTEIPSELPKSSGEDIADFAKTGDAKPEELRDSQREEIVWRMVWYAVERPFTLAAVEVSTLMMLEVFYGWDPYWTGLCFTGVCSVGIIMSAFTTVMLIKGRFQESWVFMISAASSIVGCLFLFEIVASAGWVLLIADCIIYTGATVANGIAEGWASRAAKEGTRYSNSEYRVRQLSAVTLGRFLGPIVGRFLVDFGGRNTYAAIQLLACFAGTRTVYMTCSLIWNANSARKLEAEKKAQGNAEKLLPDTPRKEEIKEESSTKAPEEEAVEDQPSTDASVQGN